MDKKAIIIVGTGITSEHADVIKLRARLEAKGKTVLVCTEQEALDMGLVKDFIIERGPIFEMPKLKDPIAFKHNAKRMHANPSRRSNRW